MPYRPMDRLVLRVEESRLEWVGWLLMLVVLVRVGVLVLVKGPILFSVAVRDMVSKELGGR